MFRVETLLTHIDKTKCKNVWLYLKHSSLLLESITSKTKQFFLTLSEDAGWVDISCDQGHML